MKRKKKERKIKIKIEKMRNKKIKITINKIKIKIREITTADKKINIVKKKMMIIIIRGSLEILQVRREMDYRHTKRLAFSSSPVTRKIITLRFSKIPIKKIKSELTSEFKRNQCF